MLCIKRPFTNGAKLGDKNFAYWHEETNINRPIVRCRVCGKKTTSVPAAGSSNIPCTTIHKHGKRICWGAGMAGIIIRKLPT